MANKVVNKKERNKKGNWINLFHCKQQDCSQVNKSQILKVIKFIHKGSEAKFFKKMTDQHFLDNFSFKIFFWHRFCLVWRKLSENLKAALYWFNKSSNLLFFLFEKVQKLSSTWCASIFKVPKLKSIWQKWHICWNCFQCFCNKFYFSLYCYRTLGLVSIMLHKPFGMSTDNCTNRKKEREKVVLNKRYIF